MAALLPACAYLHKGPQATVLFDEGHGQHFVVAGHGPLDLSSLATQFEEQGFRVTTSRQELSDTILSAVDVLMISGPFVPFMPAENEATTRFLTRGGRLCILLHIAQPVVPLLEQLNVLTSNGVIRERENVINGDPLNFHVTRLASHDLTRNLEAFDVFGAWALLGRGGNATVLAETSPSAWVDLNGDRTLSEGDAVQPFAVAVAGHFGQGRFVVFGDDAVFQNQFFTGGNAVLGKNLVRWLGRVR